jgi:hypothetical protein
MVGYRIGPLHAKPVHPPPLPDPSSGDLPAAGYAFQVLTPRIGNNETVSPIKVDIIRLPLSRLPVTYHGTRSDPALAGHSLNTGALAEKWQIPALRYCLTSRRHVFRETTQIM